MALQEQIETLEFTGGLETRADRKRVPSVRLLELENARFERAGDGGEGGTIHRRPGSAQLPDDLVEGGEITGARACQVAGSELLRWTSSGIYGRAAEPGAKWARRGDTDDAHPLAYRITQRVARARSAEAHDCVSLGPVDVIVWTEAEEAGPAGPARRVLRGSVVERGSNVYYQEATELAQDVGGTEYWRLQPRLVVLPELVPAGGTVPGTVVLIYSAGGKLYGRALYAEGFTVWSEAVELAADVATRSGVRFPYELDAIAEGDDLVRLAYTASATGTAAVTPVANTGTNPAPFVVPDGDTTFTGTLNLKVSTSTEITVAFTSVANGGLAPAPVPYRLAWAWTGTILAKITEAPAIALTKVSSGTAAGPNVPPSPVFTRDHFLFDGTMDFRPARETQVTGATNTAPHPYFEPYKTGVVNSLGLAGGTVRIEVISRRTIDPLGANLKVATLRATCTALGYSQDFVDIPTNGAGGITMAAIGYLADVPNIDSSYPTTGQYWEWTIYPLLWAYRLNGGAWVETQPGGAAMPMYAGSGAPIEYHVYSGADDQYIRAKAAVVGLSPAAWPRYQVADVWRLTLASGRVAYNVNGAGYQTPVRMYNGSSGSYYQYAVPGTSGLTVEWPEQFPTTYFTTNDVYTISVPTGQWTYRVNGAGPWSAPYPILGATGQPVATHLGLDVPSGVFLGVTVTWAQNVEHPAAEEWLVTVTSASLLIMLTLEADGLGIYAGPTDIGSPVLEGLTLQATPDPGDIRVLFRNIPGDQIEVRIYNQIHGLQAGPTVIASAPSSEAAQGLLHVGLLDTGPDTWAILEPTGQKPLELIRFNDAGPVGSPSIFARGLRLLSRPFYLGARPMVACIHLPRYGGETGTVAGFQPTAFLLTLDTGRVVGRALAGQAGPLISSGLPKILEAGEGEVAALIPQRLRLTLDRGVGGQLVDLTPQGLVQLVVREVSPAELGTVYDGDALQVGGAAPAAYDGSRFTESGFHLAPEAVQATAGAGGGLSAGAYQWAFLYEWTDARGRRHQSAPSAPVALTFGGGAGKASLEVPLLHLTRKPGVRIVGYRTTAAGQVFYRCLTVVQPEAAAITSDTVTVEDATADAALLDNEALYSTGDTGGTLGGELEHLPPPAYAAIVQHGDFLFTTSMDDPFTVRYSLPLAQGEGPAWSDLLEIRVPSEAGRVVGFGSMDSRLILFCEAAAYAVLGQGPTKAGTDNSLTPPQKLPGSVGCTDARSIVSTPDGLMFKAPAGIHLLSRGLETVAAIGDGVHAYKALTITRALDLAELREARFYTAEGTTLIYSYGWRQWSTFTGQAAVGAALVRGVPHWAVDGGGVYYEDPTMWDSDPITVGTAWLKASSFVGVQRIWRYLLLGKAVASHTLEAHAYYDYQDSGGGDFDSQEVVGTVEGGPEVYAVRHHLKQQECAAVRFVWVLFPAAGAAGQGDINLSSVSLELGVLPGKMTKRLHRSEL